MGYTPLQPITKVSTLNSLTSGPMSITGGFSGSSESVLGYTTMSVSFYTPFGTDLNGTAWLEVSRNGTDWSTIPRDVRNSATLQPILFLMAEEYFRFRFENGLDAGGNVISTVSASTIQIQVILAKDRPMTLNQQMGDTIEDFHSGQLVKSVITGHLENGKYINIGANTSGSLNTHITGPLDAFGALQTTELTPIIQLTFPYNINTNLVNVTTTSGGSVTQADNMAVVNVSTTSNQTALLESAGRVKYRAGQGVVGRFTTLFTTTATTSDSLQVMGIGEPDDGYYFGYSGYTFGIHHRTNGNVLFIPQSLWNRDVMDGSDSDDNPTGMNLLHDKGNVYQIQYQWLGYGAIKFYIEHETDGDLVLVHVDGYANQNTIPSSYDPVFHIRMEVENGTSTDSLTMKTSSMAAFIEGPDIVTGPTQSISISNTSAVIQKNLLTLRSVEFFPTGNTKECKVTSILKNLSLSNDGANNTIVKIEIIENSIVTGTTYTYIDPNNSVVEYDTVGTYVVGSGKVLTSFLLTASDSKNINLRSDDFRLEHNGTISFIASGDVSTATDIGISWVEDF